MKPRTKTFLCIAIAWVLLVCYTILLTSVAESLIDLSNFVPPNENVKQIAIFLYGLAVVSFLGGSQIPAVFLKRKSFVVQFGFSATFGLMLLLLNVLNETSLKQLNEAVFQPFFLSYPVIAIEYLSIPYFFMIFIDLHLSGHLSSFSWRRFGHLFIGTFLHPKKTFEEMASHRSTLFALVSVLFVSAAWTLRTVALSAVEFTPSRWRLLAFSVGETELISKTVLIIPATILLWLLASVLVHFGARKIGGRGCCTETTSLLGFAFIPSLLTIAVDFVEIELQVLNSLVYNLIFLILGFIIPLIMWPLTLVIFALQKSEDISLRNAGAVATVIFFPLFILLTLSFL